MAAEKGNKRPKKPKSTTKAIPEEIIEGSPTPEVQPPLEPDLQAIVDAKKASPQDRAKMTRVAFAARGWPNKQHPGSVRDFLEEHGIPIIAKRRLT